MDDGYEIRAAARKREDVEDRHAVHLFSLINARLPRPGVPAAVAAADIIGT